MTIQIKEFNKLNGYLNFHMVNQELEESETY